MVQSLLFSGCSPLRFLGIFGRVLVGCGSVVLVSYFRKNGGKRVKANIVVADQPNLWGLVILVVSDYYIVCADLKQMALCNFHIGTIKKSSALLLISSDLRTYLASTTPAAGITDTLGAAAVASSSPSSKSSSSILGMSSKSGVSVIPTPHHVLLKSVIKHFNMSRNMKKNLDSNIVDTYLHASHVFSTFLPYRPIFLYYQGDLILELVQYK